MGKYAEINYTPAPPTPQTLGNPTSGDFVMGAGVSTAQLANPGVALIGKSGAQTASGPAWMQSPGVWAGIVIGLILLKIIMERKGKSEFASVRIGLESWLVVTLLAATGIYALKISVPLIPIVPPAVKQFVGVI